jgi:hypothetical protein
VASAKSGAVAYLRAERGGAALYVVRAGQTSRVGPAAPSGPAAEWSPDGQTVAYRDQRSRLAAYGPAGRRVLEPLPLVDRFAWSPQGDRIAYLVRSAAGGEVRVVRASGSKPQVITFDGDMWTLAWSPDAATLAHIGVAQLEFSDTLEDLRVSNSTGGSGTMTIRSIGSTQVTCCLAWSHAGLVYAVADRVKGVAKSPVAYRTKAPWRGDPGVRLIDGFPVAYSPQGHLLVQRGERVAVVTPAGRVSAQFAGTDPSWSASGKRVAVQRGGRIAVVQPGSGAPRLVATGRDAAWTGDDTLVFQRPGCGAGAGLYSLVLGRQPRRIAAAAC